ncbi:hypothetical protein H4696_003341 [Amycolatopsis lexingtonensis]|uniref:Uncharacterized protein n=1 Tax=Amycolatopsis lexingtonensis TaxID=218822 RepID=A0ABR9HZ94_9PSEU|nr:hypothetical protein [Amycolatopsis lexingtonensis]MBE1496241.1 hypothetical protein [Amycolatopsis lexingtonensis]
MTSLLTVIAAELTMLVVPATKAMRRWTAHLDVWPGRGPGLPEQDISGFVAALGEVMKTRRCWRERQSKGTRAGRGSEQV